MKSIRAIGASLAMLAVLAASSSGQTWTPLNHQPSFGAGNELLLTDGTVMVQQADGIQWWKLTPDSKGSYQNGTWTQLASTTGWGPLYYASQVLPDGRVFAEGGEYNNSSRGVWTNIGKVYTPSTNTWAAITPPSNWTQMGDTGSVVLNDGTVLVADPLTNQCAIWSPSTNAYGSTFVNGKADGNDEEPLTKMPNGNVFTIDAVDRPNSEIYNWQTQSWSSAGNTPVLLADPSTEEIGPAVLGYDGKIMCFGSLGNNAIFDTTTQTWSTAPPFPAYNNSSQLYDCEDAPGAVEINGKEIVMASPGVFNSPSQMFEWDGTNLTMIANPPNAVNDPSYVGTFLMLPTGQILFTDQSGSMELLTSAGSANSAWAPTISSAPSTVSAGSSYSISGTQFNGLTGDTFYGDDEQNETNYPQIRITNNSTGDVFYCFEYNPSTMAICTGSATVSTNFTVPSSIESGASTLQVVCNGIASSGVAVTVSGTSSGPQISSISPTSCNVGGALTLTVNGSGFSNKSKVNFNGTALSTKFVSASQLTATITNTFTQTAGDFPITVTDSGNTSNSATFEVDNPVPSVHSVSPTSIYQGSGDTTISVVVYNGEPTTTIAANGMSLATTYVSSTNYTAVVPASMLTHSGSLKITAVSPPPGGGTSANFQTITIIPVTGPTIQNLNPSSALQGTSTSMQVNGVGFDNTCVVSFNGSALSTTFVSNTQLTVNLTSTQTATTGSFPVTVKNSANQTSNSVNFVVYQAGLSIASINPTTCSINTAVALTVNGNDFTAASVVNWNGSPLSTKFVNANQLTATVTTTNTAVGGVYPVTVTDSGNTSNSVNFTVTNPVPIVHSVSPSSIPHGSGDTTISVVVLNGVGNTTILVNGTAVSTTFVSSTNYTAVIPASMLVNKATLKITASNPAPGGGASTNFQTVTVS